MKKLFMILTLMVTVTAIAQTTDPFANSIVNGVPWTDDQGKPVNAHGA